MCGFFFFMQFFVGLLLIIIFWIVSRSWSINFRDCVSCSQEYNSQKQWQDVVGEFPDRDRGQKKKDRSQFWRRFRCFYLGIVHFHDFLLVVNKDRQKAKGKRFKNRLVQRRSETMTPIFVSVFNLLWENNIQ